MNSLNPKQERFVTEYLIDFNGSAAAVRAGYSKKTAREQASRLLTKVNIQRALKWQMEKTTRELEITTEHIVAGLIKEATNNGKGANHMARVRAWECLGKYRGMFINRVAVEQQAVELPRIIINVQKIDPTNPPTIEDLYHQKR